MTIFSRYKRGGPGSTRPGVRGQHAQGSGVNPPRGQVSTCPRVRGPGSTRPGFRGQGSTRPGVRCQHTQGSGVNMPRGQGSTLPWTSCPLSRPPSLRRCLVLPAAQLRGQVGRGSDGQAGEPPDQRRGLQHQRLRLGGGQGVLRDRHQTRGGGAHATAGAQLQVAKGPGGGLLRAVIAGLQQACHYMLLFRNIAT